jgi:serine/threonine protein kinase
VYSFGVMVAELLEGKHPFASVFEKCKAPWEFPNKLRNKEIPPPQFSSDNALTRLIKQCISWNPESRPSFIEIETCLNKIMINNL